MAKGTFTNQVVRRGPPEDRKPPTAEYIQNIACQFTPDQFALINNYARGMGISFSAAIRHLIFHGDAPKLKSKDAEIRSR